MRITHPKQKTIWCLIGSKMNKQLLALYDASGEEIIEIIKDRFYWVSASYVPRSQPQTYYFSIENQLAHLKINYENGPLHIQHCWYYINKVHQILTHPKYKSSFIYHYTGRRKAHKANAALLVGVFMIGRLRLTVDHFEELFQRVQLVGFRDASFQHQSSEVTVTACLRGMEKALQLGWMDFDRYDFKAYRELNSQENYLTTFLIPDKLMICGDLLLFEKNHELSKNIDSFANMMRDMGLEMMFRFNEENYKSIIFRKAGVRFYQMHKPDQFIPSDQRIQEFLDLAFSVKGVIGLQCKDGMIQSAFMAALFIIEKYELEVDWVVGYMRMVRPGCLHNEHHEFLRRKYRDIYYFPYGRLEQIVIKSGMNSPTKREKEVE